MSNGNVSAQGQTAEQAIERASLRRGQAVPVRRLVLAGMVTLAGFAAAILSNRLIPQVAQGPRTRSTRWGR